MEDWTAYQSLLSHPTHQDPIDTIRYKDIELSPIITIACKNIKKHWRGERGHTAQQRHSPSECVTRMIAVLLGMFIISFSSLNWEWWEIDEKLMRNRWENVPQTVSSGWICLLERIIYIILWWMRSFLGNTIAIPSVVSPITAVPKCNEMCRFFFRVDFHVPKWTRCLLCKVLAFTLREILSKMHKGSAQDSSRISHWIDTSALFGYLVRGLTLS